MRTAMMAMTTSSSIRVKAWRGPRVGMGAPPLVMTRAVKGGVYTSRPASSTRGCQPYGFVMIEEALGTVSYLDEMLMEVDGYAESGETALERVDGVLGAMAADQSNETDKVINHMVNRV